MLIRLPSIGIFLYFLLLLNPARAQNTYNLSGVIKNEQGERVFGAVVSVKGPLTTATSTDFDGKYSLTVLPGVYTITIEGFGLVTQTQTLEIRQDIPLNLSMKEDAIIVEEVVIEAPDKVEQNVTSTDMGKVELDMKDMKKIPALLGEVDAMKTLQLLPGVQSAGEGVGGIFVRGGSVDQNLVLLDDAPIYNPSHLFGFFSVFNSGAIDNVTLYKGMIPGQYGGRLSSVVDFKGKKPNLDSLTAEGGIGIVSSKLTVQAPIVKGKNGFMLAGRRTYIDVLSKAFENEEEERQAVPYYFQDYNFRFYHKFSEKDELLYSGYYGDDVLSFDLLDDRVEADISWGNIMSSLTWKHQFNDDLDMDVIGYYTFYRFKAETRFDDLETNAASKIRDYGFKTIFNQYISEKHRLQYGGELIFHKYTPRDIESGSLTGTEYESGFLNIDRYAREGALFFEDEININKKLRANLALRWSIFSQTGPYNTLDEINEFEADTVTYDKDQVVKTYTAFEPRLGLRYLVGKNGALKASIVRNNQYVHLASFTGNNLPFDAWVPSSDVIEPQSGWQYALGYFRNFNDNTTSSSIEIYYRNMENVIDFNESFVPSLNDDVEFQLVAGRGWAYGAEFLLRKEKGKFQGWLGYTLSWTTLQFDEINEGNPYPSKYDRRHDLSVVAMFEPTPKWTFSATFVYGTGQPVTIQEGKYFIGESIINIYGPRNGFRMPAYHRLDLGITWKPMHSKKRFKSQWTLAVYNVYNRANPYFIFVGGEYNETTDEIDVEAKLIYLFPILPTINWSFTF